METLVARTQLKPKDLRYDAGPIKKPARLTTKFIMRMLMELLESIIDAADPGRTSPGANIFFRVCPAARLHASTHQPPTLSAVPCDHAILRNHHARCPHPHLIECPCCHLTKGAALEALAKKLAGAKDATRGMITANNGEAGTKLHDAMAQMEHEVEVVCHLRPPRPPPPLHHHHHLTT